MIDDRLMKKDAIAFGVAGILFGLIAGWIIGAQQAARSPRPSTVGAAEPAPAGGGQPQAAILDEAKVSAFKSIADREPANPKPRAELGKLYFDAERYDDAIRWYSDALKLAPNDVNVSTELAVSYYYANQADKALEQLSRSLKIDPKHAKTLLSLGIVRAFGKQDLQGAQDAWQQAIEAAPESAEGQAAKRLLDTLRSSHPSSGSKPGA
jgi:tetratricopeptide (TPR) repeat protein